MSLTIKILVAILVVGMLALSVYLFNPQEKRVTTEYFQGPVPEGYDEKYFRTNGITRPLENDING